jgi:N-acetylglucosaminyl-diphospho-decaprenol L-rhamnosyltransferase
MTDKCADLLTAGLREPGSGTTTLANTTVVVVAYGNRRLDLSWVPDATPVVLVHNDDSLVAINCPSSLLTHVRPGRNLGFGQGVNEALRHVRTPRVLLANPDTELTPRHWALLDTGDADEIITVPQSDDLGRPNSVVNLYPTAAVLLAQAWRVGRWLPRGSRARALAARLLGRQGSVHVDLLTPTSAGQLERLLPLREFWVSGSLLSLHTERLRAVDGFSDRFFLYYEDVDVCARMAERFPEMRIRLRSGAGPALHTVGASARSAGARKVRHIRRQSAGRYAGAQKGRAWSTCAAVLALASVPVRQEAQA